MPFEPSLDEPGALVCTLCSSTVPAAELISHVCVPQSIRDRQAPPPPAAPETPQQAPQPGVESFLGTGAPIPGAVASVLEEPPPDGPLGAEQLAGDPEARVYFTLGGEKFRGVEELSFGVQLDVAKAFETNNIAASALVALIRGIVHPDDEERFEQVLYSKTIRIDAEELRDALVSVIRAIGGRPSPGSSA